jgi:hypothetical protein
MAIAIGTREIKLALLKQYDKTFIFRGNIADDLLMHYPSS